MDGITIHVVDDITIFSNLIGESASLAMRNRLSL